jgi:DNA-binding NtrC family response regulator
LAHSSHFTIYVLHDDLVVMQTLLDFLADLGHRPAPIHSTLDLLANLGTTAQKVNVVIAGVGVLGTYYADVMREARQRQPDVAFVLFTDGGSSLTASEAAALGVYGFLRTPIRLSELELLLARLSDTVPNRPKREPLRPAVPKAATRDGQNAIDRRKRRTTP